MCCLRYEHRTYDELRKKLPPRNTLVDTPEGQGLVVDCQILTQLVMVRLADARRVAFPLSEITVLSDKPDPSAQAKAQPGAKENSLSPEQPSPQSTSDSQSTSGGPRRRRRNKRRNSNRSQG